MYKIITICVLLLITGCVSPQNKAFTQNWTENEKQSINEKSSTTTIWYNESGKKIKEEKKEVKTETDIEIIESTETKEDTKIIPWYQKYLDYLIIGIVAALLCIVIWIKKSDIALWFWESLLKVVRMFRR